MNDDINLQKRAVQFLFREIEIVCEPGGYVVVGGGGGDGDRERPREARKPLQQEKETADGFQNKKSFLRFARHIPAASSHRRGERGGGGRGRRAEEYYWRDIHIGSPSTPWQQRKKVQEGL